MKLTTIVGLILHIIVVVFATIFCDLFLGSVNIISNLTEVAFISKYNAAIRNGVLISALFYIIWQFAGRFFYINDIMNSKFHMRRNWIVLFILVVLLQFIFYSLLKEDYSSNGFYEIIATFFIFAIPGFAFWLSTAAASPSLFKYAAPWSRFVRHLFDRIYKNSTSRS